MAMYISDERHWPQRSECNIHFFSRNIRVTVTPDSNVAADWLRATVLRHRNYRRRLVVGFGVQRNRFHGGHAPAHTLQLCVGNRCLIFQLALADAVPLTLRHFLLNSDNTFVGLWISGVDRRLMDSEHRLVIRRLLDLRLIVRTDDGRLLDRAMIEEIAEVCLGYEGVRIRNDIIRSAWDARRLSEAQVLQAAVVGHISFLIGSNYRVWEL